MKILNIHFKNINSLEGESRVDFEQAPFTDTGVFAITGPNGSGKSSLLDVITLGLYGETFRFNRPASHVMTRHTDSCFAAIEFSIAGKHYRSSWQVERVDGSLTAPVMHLLQLPEQTLLADSPSQVCAQITDITGMNFRNFTRSILLAQGDFAAFLNALDNERMDILEKIISTDIYADYREEVTTKAAQAQQELHRLQQELAAIEVLPPESLEAYEHDLIDFNEHLSELKDEQSRLKEQQALLMNINALKRQIAEQEHHLEQAQAEYTQVQQAVSQIDNGQAALNFKDDLASQHTKAQQAHEGRASLADLQDELKQLKKQWGNAALSPAPISQQSFAEQQQRLLDLNNQIAQLSLNSQSESAHLHTLQEQAAEKQLALDSVSAWLAEHSTEAELLNDFPAVGALKKARNDVAELLNQQKTFSKQAQKTTSTFKNNSAALTKEIQLHKDYQHKLEAAQAALAEMASGHSGADLDALKQEQQDRVKDFQALYKLALKYEHNTVRKSFFGLFKAPEPVEYNAETLTTELEKLRLELKREENIKRVLEEAIIREGLMKKMAADKAHLVDGKPCPLCGALQHPYVKYPPALTNSKQALIDQKAKLRALVEKTTVTGRKITEAGVQAERKQAREIQLQLLRGQWLNLCTRLNAVSDELDITQLSKIKQRIKSETAELAELNNFIARYRSKQQSIEKLTALIAKSVVKQEQLQASTAELGVNNEGLNQEQQALQAAIALSQSQEQELAVKVLGQLSALGEKMPDKGKDEALIDRLNNRRQEYHGYQFRHKNLSEELAILANKQTVSLAEIARCNTQLEQLGSELHAQEALALHLAVLEKQRLIAEKEQWLAQLDQDLGRLQQTLQANLQASPFASLSEVTNVLALMERQPELLRLAAELEQAIDAHNIAIASGNTQLLTDSAELGSDLSTTEVAEQLRRLARKIEMNRMEAQQRERILGEQEQLKQHRDALLRQWQQQDQAAQPYFAEAALLTAENGMAFRRRVQERIADQLLSRTNAILEKISGRYYLRLAPSEQGLALEVEDTFQNNVRRLPKSLSGGESFIVSLALALGLSELANNGRSVDSLFLDEGFGNLDAESLYTVISTLENLHTQGKTVGVISHVEAVQKRFKAQLQVVKKANGMGELRKAS